MRQLTRAEYFLRHLLTFAPYVTVAKLYNLALNAIELRARIATPRSLPPYVKVEPTPLCQMACQGCAHGNRQLKRELFHNRLQLRLEDFKLIMEPLWRTTLGVSFSLRGEPLLGKDLIPMIEYAHSRGVAVSFPTNLSMKLSHEKLMRLVRSGVDTLYVSLDGTTPDAYEKYRIGGDFQQLLANVKAIADIRAHLRRSRPRLVWKFVIFEHNLQQVPEVKTRYRELGFDSYELVDDYDGDIAKESLRKYNAQLVSKRRGCYWAWHTMVIRADGVVAPCCLGHQNFGLGNARFQSLPDIWRGQHYAQLRRGFATMDPADLHPVCTRCLGVVGTRHSLDDAEPEPMPPAPQQNAALPSR